MNDVFKKYVSILKSPKVLIIAGMTGILLIFLSSFNFKEDKKVKADSSFSEEEYRKSVQESITDIVKGITGSDNVTVAITLDSGVRYSYADANEGTSQNKTESDSAIVSSESKQTYITVKTADGGEEALLVTTVMPEIRGVAIVCEGGDDEVINDKICNAVTAALDITSKRVYIAGGNKYEKR